MFPVFFYFSMAGSIDRSVSHVNHIPEALSGSFLRVEDIKLWNDDKKTMTKSLPATRKS